MVAFRTDSASAQTRAPDSSGDVLGMANFPDRCASAEHDYTRSGMTRGSTAPLAESDTFRFSARHHEVEIGLYYYGYRFYSPRLGRWVNRDPIRERGGINLLRFVGNRPLSRVDRLGAVVVKLSPEDAKDTPWEHVSGEEHPRGETFPDFRRGCGCYYSNPQKTKARIKCTLSLSVRIEIKKSVEEQNRVLGHEQRHAENDLNFVSGPLKAYVLKAESEEMPCGKCPDYRDSVIKKIDDEWKHFDDVESDHLHDPFKDHQDGKFALFDPLPGTDPLPETPEE